MMIDQSRTINSHKGENEMARKATTTTTEAEAEVTEEIFSAKDLATEAGTDAKSFRRWLRAHFDRPNKGERWVFTADQKAEVLEAFLSTPEPVELTEID
jgi:hypothetical protein